MMQHDAALRRPSRCLYETDCHCQSFHSPIEASLLSLRPPATSSVITLMLSSMRLQSVAISARAQLDRLSLRGEQKRRARRDAAARQGVNNRHWRPEKRNSAITYHSDGQREPKKERDLLAIFFSGQVPGSWVMT